MFIGNAERISNFLNAAQAKKANSDWIKGAVGIGLKWLFDAAMAMDPIDMINPGRVWRRGKNFVTTLLTPQKGTKQQAIEHTANSLLQERVNGSMNETLKKQKEIAEEEAIKETEEAMRQAEEAEKKYQSDLSDYQKKARDSLLLNAILFQDVEDTYAMLFSEEGQKEYEEKSRQKSQYERNVRAGKMFPGKDVDLDNKWNALDAKHPTAELYYRLVDGPESPVQSRFLDSAWKQLHGHLSGLALSKKTNTVYNRMPDFKYMIKRLSQMKNHDPRQYLATLHPEILEEALKDPELKDNQEQLKKILKQKVKDVGSLDAKRLENEFDYITQQNGYKVREPVKVKDNDNKETEIKGDPQTPTINQMKFNGILFDDTEELFPNVVNKD